MNCANFSLLSVKKIRASILVESDLSLKIKYLILTIFLIHTVLLFDKNKCREREKERERERGEKCIFETRVVRGQRGQQEEVMWRKGI
jgi:hypothetical protein